VGIMELRMKTLNPVYPEAVARMISECPYFTLISMEMKNVEYGHCRIEVVVKEKHLQNFGIVHGGVYSSLVDAAAFWAVYPQIDGGLGMTTVEIKVNFLAPASTGHLIAKGRSIKAGKTLCLGEALIEDEIGKSARPWYLDHDGPAGINNEGKFEAPAQVFVIGC
jgi:uncharacterized protein (TIGR00369 family)